MSPCSASHGTAVALSSLHYHCLGTTRDVAADHRFPAEKDNLVANDWQELASPECNHIPGCGNLPHLASIGGELELDTGSDLSTSLIEQVQPSTDELYPSTPHFLTTDAFFQVKLRPEYERRPPA